MFIKKILLISTFFYTSLCFAEDENFYTAFKSGASFGQNTGLVNYDNNLGGGGAATLENSDLSSSLTSGISVGMYFTDNLRGDFHSNIKITKSYLLPILQYLHLIILVVLAV